MVANETRNRKIISLRRTERHPRARRQAIHQLKRRPIRRRKEAELWVGSRRSKKNLKKIMTF